MSDAPDKPRYVKERNVTTRLTDRIVRAVALTVYHAPFGKRFLNWFFDWCER